MVSIRRVQGRRLMSKRKEGEEGNMAKKRTQVNVRASGNLGDLTGSARITVSPKPPEKPPWRKRLKDLSWKALGTVIGKYIYDGLSSVDWNAVRDTLQKLLQRCFGRKRQPAEAGQP